MNTELEIAVKARRKQRIRDDATLAYARRLNSAEATPKKSARTQATELSNEAWRLHQRAKKPRI